MVMAVPQIWIRSWWVTFNRSVPTELERTRKREESGVKAGKQKTTVP